MEIEFTQYLLPDGRKVFPTIERPDEICELAYGILRTGKYRFECEMLRTGLISFTCFDIEKEVDITIELSTNDNAVLGAIDKMIQDSHRLILEMGNGTTH